MKEIDEFISIYNVYLNEKLKKFDDVEIISWRSDLREGSYKTPITYFLQTFKFPSTYNYSGFCFIDNAVAIGEDYIHFATHVDYNLLYVYCLNDGKIYLWDQEYERIEWSCSESLPVFFDSMCAVLRTKIKMLQTETYDLDEEYLKSVVRYCLSLNDDNEEYVIFYEHILGIL